MPRTIIEFAVILTFLLYIGQQSQIVTGLYVVTSLITFSVYALDKFAATNGRRRTPERVLHCLALAGGWPGGFLAQRVLHHKSKKQRFRRIFWVTVAGNCAVLFWLLQLRKS